MSAADELSAFMDDRGRLNYGENVTIAEHSLLTAAAAEQQGHHDTLVAACLMHDVGHWLDEPDDGYGIHDHGDLGGRRGDADQPVLGQQSSGDRRSGIEPGDRVLALDDVDDQPVHPSVTIGLEATSVPSASAEMVKSANTFGAAFCSWRRQSMASARISTSACSVARIATKCRQAR